MNIHEYIESGLLELYAMGALPDDEARDVADAIARYPELRAEFEAISATLEAFAPVQGRGPSAGLKDSILDALPTDEKGGSMERVADVPARNNVVSLPDTGVSEKTGSAGPRRYLLAASFIGLLLSASAAFWFWNQWKSTEEQLAQAHDERRQIEQIFQQAQEELRTLRNYENRMVRMTSTGNVQGAIAVVYWNPETRNVYLDAAGMPPLPEDKQYQLWAIADGDPVDAGVFDPDGNHLQIMKDIAEAKVFAVTIEPRGGSVKPTLEAMTVVGQL